MLNTLNAVVRAIMYKKGKRNDATKVYNATTHNSYLYVEGITLNLVINGNLVNSIDLQVTEVEGAVHLIDKVLLNYRDVTKSTKNPFQWQRD